jgi:hypothetical protein
MHEPTCSVTRAQKPLRTIDGGSLPKFYGSVFSGIESYIESNDTHRR